MFISLPFGASACNFPADAPLCEVFGAPQHISLPWCPWPQNLPLISKFPGHHSTFSFLIPRTPKTHPVVLPSENTLPPLAPPDPKRWLCQKAEPPLLPHSYCTIRLVYPIRLSSTALAASLPSRIAHTTRDWPLCMSPAVKTFFTLVS